MKTFGYLDSNLLLTSINSAHDGWFYTNEDGIISFCNEAYEKITAIDKKHLVGKSVYNLINYNFPISDMTIKVHENKKEITRVIQYDDKDISEILVTLTPVYMDGQFKGTVGNVRNLTEMINDRQKLSLVEPEDIIKSRKKLDKMERELDEAIARNQDTTKILNEKLKSISGVDSVSFTGRSKHRYELLQSAFRLSKVDSPILITGETGVGKDVFTNILHNSKSTSSPIVKVSCGALPENLIESELFGYEPGAFTGANKNGKKGLFELAGNGTLFLDEIGELPLNMQVKLLTVLQDRKFYRIGGSKTIDLKARIVSATNRNLEDDIKSGTFREDLYYRLNVIPVHILPLRERTDDIFPIIEDRLSRLNQKHKLNKRLDPKVVEIMEKYSWPGNIRQLVNIVERIYVLSESNLICEDVLPKDLVNEYNSSNFEISGLDSSLKDNIESLEYNLLSKLLESNKTMAEIAKQLDISLATLHRKTKKYKLSKKN